MRKVAGCGGPLRWDGLGFNFDEFTGDALGGDPVHGQEFFEFVLCRVMHEFFEDPFKVSVWIEAVAANLFDEGVDDGAAPAGFFVADEHPVFHAEFCGPNRAFGEVVVEFNLPIKEAGFEMLPLLEGIGQRFPKITLGKDAESSGFLKVGEEFGKVIVVTTGLEPADSLSIKGS